MSQADRMQSELLKAPFDHTPLLPKVLGSMQFVPRIFRNLSLFTQQGMGTWLSLMDGEGLVVHSCTLMPICSRYRSTIPLHYKNRQ